VNDGRILNDILIANLLRSVTVKEFWRSVSIWQGQMSSSHASPVHITATTLICQRMTRGHSMLNDSWSFHVEW